MLSIQEIVAKTEKQRNIIKLALESQKEWHPRRYLSKYGSQASIFANQKQADIIELRESIQNIPLAELLAKSGTTGISGAAYLVPDKLYDTVIYSSARTDYTPLISAYMATRWEGGDLKVPIVSKTSYAPQPFSSGGKKTETEPKTKLPPFPLKPIGFHVTPHIGSDLIEDNQYDLIQYLVEKAGMSLGEYATNMALTVLKAAADGWGTVNGGATTDANQTMWVGAAGVDVEDCLAELSDDHWIPDTMIITTEAWEHSVRSTLPRHGTEVNKDAVYWTPQISSAIPITQQSPAQGFDAKLGMPPLDVLFCNYDALHAAPEDAMTDCVTIIYDRQNALLTGRKRWMQLENFSNPLEDLAGVTISCRQDSVTLYNDAVAVITET